MIFLLCGRAGFGCKRSHLFGQLRWHPLIYAFPVGRKRVCSGHDTLNHMADALSAEALFLGCFGLRLSIDQHAPGDLNCVDSEPS
ncbi:hypothetical protein PK69_22815 [Xanthomonas phaseoli pv. phaseoli]|nr:hypothetical protein AC609_23075 [Xanthomonas phaseoli pv. phaseoli]AZU19687.1 hypothetical protein AC613_22380 [Xanthomonas citri pv. fuscans]AZU32634.1 hypothetical protein AC801_22685 [Xanthomonas sp. ISO98C4]AZU23872.1 hypothetical protein AC612_22370 [Xanthomonas citri pv. fuscans]AZU28245.1 hypothetical protein AC611_23105 [Xanthomonas phaseoli pv. phaseoli]